MTPFVTDIVRRRRRQGNRSEYGDASRKTATCQEAKLPKQGKPPFGHFQVRSPPFPPFNLPSTEIEKQTSKDLHLSSCWHKLHGADEIVFTLTLAIRISTSLSTTESHPMSCRPSVRSIRLSPSTEMSSSSRLGKKSRYWSGMRLLVMDGGG